MRCDNCGWDNSPNSSTCLKCGHVLSGQVGSGFNGPMSNGSYISEEAKKTRVISVVDDAAAQLKKTVIQGVQTSPAMQKSASGGLCPRCRYPMTGNYCANCGYSEDDATEQDTKDETNNSWKETGKVVSEYMEGQNECSKCGAKVPRDYKYCPMCAEPIIPSTINPFGKNRRHDEPKAPQPKCTLELIPDENDEEKPENIKHEYEGAEIMLCRENTDAFNRTITSKEQALICCQDGKWTIVNRSEFQSTLVSANREIELQSGDVIMLGDRRFRFGIEH